MSKLSNIFFTDSLMKYWPTIDGEISGIAVQSRFPYWYSCTCTRLKSWLPTRYSGMLRWYKLSASSTLWS